MAWESASISPAGVPAGEDRDARGWRGGVRRLRGHFWMDLMYSLMKKISSGVRAFCSSGILASSPPT